MVEINVINQCFPKYVTVSNELQYGTLLSARSDLGSNYALYKLNNGKWQILATSSSPSASGINDLQFCPQDNEPDQYGVVRSTSANTTGNYNYAAIYVRDSSNNVIGAIVCYRNIDTGNNEIQSGTIMLMMGIVSGLITLSFLVMEGSSWIKLYLKRKKKDKLARGTSEFSITRPLYCLMTAASAADATIGVLIFQDMLVGTPFEGNTILISLPLTFKIIGSMVGIVIFAPLVRRLGTKRLLLMSAAFAALCFAFCAFSVSVSKLILVSLGLLAANIFKEILWMYLDDVPSHIEDGRKRKELNNNCSASSICGSALITIVAGYASVAFGDWVVYLCAAAVIVVVFVILFFLLPKRTALDIANENKKETKQKNSIKEMFKFIFRIDIISLILSAYAIGILVSGYKSFIFPLLADMSGVSKSDVSNISVFANAIAFYITPLFTSIQKNLGSVRVLVFSGLIIGVIFALFIFNSSFIWACCAYFVSQIINKIMNPCRNDYWQDIAIESKSDTNAALTGMTAANKVLDLSKNTVMGVLMGVGSVFACVVIGVYSIAASSLFGLISKREAKDVNAENRE